LSQLFKKHKTIFSIVDEPPSWSDADDNLESMSDPEEDEDDMPDDNDKDSTRSGVGAGVGDGDGEGEVVVDVVADRDGDGETREEEEDSSDDFFDASEGAVIHDRLSLRAASESGQSGSGGGTEDDPVGPVTPSAANNNSLPHNTKPTAIEFSRTISSDSTDLDDEEWVDPTPIPPTPLETSPPAFPPPIIAKTKSSSSGKSRKRKEPRAHVPFPSSVQEGVQEDRPRRIPQMSTARGRDGGRTQSGGVKGVIALDPGPAELDDPDGDDF
jgi:cysteine protease ATG4